MQGGVEVLLLSSFLQLEMQQQKMLGRFAVVLQLRSTAVSLLLRSSASQKKGCCSPSFGQVEAEAVKLSVVRCRRGCPCCKAAEESAFAEAAAAEARC